MHTVKAKNIADAYYGMAMTVLTEGVKQENGTTEVTNVMVEVENPMQNTYVPNRDMNLKWGLPVSYMIGELLWSGMGSNSVDYIAQFSKFWERLTEDGETVNSSYGYIATKKFGFNQIERMIKELKANPDSRRATLNINVPRTPGTPNLTQTKDEWCTMYLQFAIKDGKLEQTAVMRSNDIWLGFPTDYTYFLYIQYLIAEGLGLEVGKYTHIANSLHVYDNHLEDLKRHCKDMQDPSKNTYNNWTIDYSKLLKPMIGERVVTQIGVGVLNNLEYLYLEFLPKASLNYYNKEHGTNLSERTTEVDLYTRKRLMTICKELDIFRPNEKDTFKIGSPIMYSPK